MGRGQNVDDLLRFSGEPVYAPRTITSNSWVVRLALVLVEGFDQRRHAAEVGCQSAELLWVPADPHKLGRLRRDHQPRLESGSSQKTRPITDRSCQ